MDLNRVFDDGVETPVVDKDCDANVISSDSEASEEEKEYSEEDYDEKRGELVDMANDITENVEVEMKKHRLILNENFLDLCEVFY